ncbi:hypothetical protein SVIOM342S_03168 [Streptomyces violaceorubidus]
MPGELAAALAGTPGPVLLVDDYSDSGWTLAVGARLLRQAGAGEVLPLVLAWPDRASGPRSCPGSPR